ncbi:Putative vgr related protein [Minicystis rosea]|nr:Putative vgr related protein [Minicystis rosea]
MPEQTAYLDLRGEKLPTDVAVIRYAAREAISRPYEIQVELSTADPGYRIDACLRTSVLLTLIDAVQGQRVFHGVVDHAEFIGWTGTHYHFTIRLRPALAALAHREDSRIFQEQSVLDVIKTIFSEAGIARVDDQTKASYEPRELIVQYRESQLNFVQRLMEDEGIFYFFRHEPEGHTLVLGDTPEAFVPSDDAPEVSFAMAQGIGGLPLDDFSRTRSLRTSAVRLRDFDFEKPGVKPDAKIPAKEAWSMPHYEYPGGFVKGAVGSQRATARMRELRRDADIVRGSSRAIGLRCGVPFAVDGAAQPTLNGEFVIVELYSRGEQTLESGGDNAVCENEFVGIPRNASYAPARVARRPRIRGIQTATVAGPSGAEQAIHVDRYGRIKVRFPWDRVSQQDGTSSPWLRVAQLPMGGSMILPRVTWEVSVAFLEGDPDRPLVLGRLYNAEKTPPYALPGTQASGSLRSTSSPGGAGVNEISMADSGGSQGWNMHAAKDLNIRVNHDKKEKVGVDETHNVTVNVQVSVGANDKLTVGGNQALDVGAVLSHHIGGTLAVKVGGNETDNATANYVEKVSGDRKYDVGGNMITISNTVKLDVGGNLERTVGTADVIGSVASIQTNIGGNFDENVGAVKIELMKGTSSETVGGSKNLTSLAAELHLVSGNMESSADASVTNLVGGLHYEKIAGDYTIKAPIVAMIGAIGDLKGGGSSLKLGGGPVVLTGSQVNITTALLVKLGGSLTMGS